MPFVLYYVFMHHQLKDHILVINFMKMIGFTKMKEPVHFSPGSHCKMRIEFPMKFICCKNVPKQSIQITTVIENYQQFQ